MLEIPAEFVKLNIATKFDKSDDHLSFLSNLITTNKNWPHSQKAYMPENWPVFLSLVFKHNGFISGGFAERVCANVLMCNLVKNRSENLLLVLFHSDIDVWFPSKAEYEAFERDLLATNHFEKVNSVFQSTWATNYRFFPDLKQKPDDVFKYQVITHNFGSPAEILKDFDIYNAMCYISKDGIFMPKDYEYLLHAGQLHVQKIDFKTIKRLCKWKSKKAEYTEVTEETNKLLSSKLEDIIEKTLSNKLKYFGKIIKPQVLSTLLLNKLFKLHPKYLVLLAQFGSDSYSYDAIENIRIALKE